MSSLLTNHKDRLRSTKSLSDFSPTSSTTTAKSPRFQCSSCDRQLKTKLPRPILYQCCYHFLYYKHERLSRLSSSGTSDASLITPTNHAESYFSKRENRLSARKKAEEENANNEYKKMYEKALATNQRLKFRLKTSEQELAMIQDQLHSAKNGRQGSCGSNMLETEKKGSWSLKKRITDMEEQLKVKAELKTENQRLKDENGALIRVITKLSK